ncbi:hypothetical protein Vafri_323, partial [Volvox africanus]
APAASAAPSAPPVAEADVPDDPGAAAAGVRDIEAGQGSDSLGNFVLRETDEKTEVERLAAAEDAAMEAAAEAAMEAYDTEGITSRREVLVPFEGDHGLGDGGGTAAVSAETEVDAEEFD